MILITAPVETESGYGHKSREIVKPIVEKYGDEVQIISIPWGSNPMTGLIDNEYSFIKDNIVDTVQNKPDLHIHIGLPTEFRKTGSTNILFTSGVETDRISPKWLQALNTCDHIVVPSSYTKNVISNITYKDKSGKEFKVNTEVEVVPESYNPKLLNDITDEHKMNVESALSHIDEKEWFITYGQMSRKKKIGSNRKNIGTLAQEFVKEFAGNRHVALLIKTSSTNFSHSGYYEIEKYLQRCIELSGIADINRPNVYLLKGYMEPEEMFYLMSHDNVKAHVTATHGEGFGRFLLEASLSSKKMIVPKVGAFRDFLRGKHIYLVNGSFEKVPQEAVFRDTITKESKWYDVHKTDLRKQLQNAYGDRDGWQDSAEELAKRNREDYHFLEIESKVLSVINSFYSEKVQVKIPKID